MEENAGFGVHFSSGLPINRGFERKDVKTGVTFGLKRMAFERCLNT